MWPDLEVLKKILDMDVSEDDKTRTLELLAKQQEGRITVEETEELESFIRVDNLLSVLKAEAILALKKAGQGP